MTFQFSASRMLKILMYHLSFRNLGDYVTREEWQLIPAHLVFKNTYSFKEKVFKLEETCVLDPAGRFLSISFPLGDGQKDQSLALFLYSAALCRRPCMIAEDPA